MSWRQSFLIILLLPCCLGFSASSYHLLSANIISQVALTAADTQRIETVLTGQRERLEGLFHQQLHEKPRIQIYASTQAFTDATRAAWFVGGITQRGQIHLQPLATLARKQKLDAILRHEYTHVFVETFFPNLPAFVNEGVALWFSGLEVTPLPAVSFEQLARWEANPSYFERAADMNRYLASCRGFIADMIAQDGLDVTLARIQEQDRVLFEENYRQFFQKNSLSRILHGAEFFLLTRPFHFSQCKPFRWITTFLLLTVQQEHNYGKAQTTWRSVSGCLHH